MSEKGEVYTALQRKVSGGDLPIGDSWKMDVTADFEDVSREELIKLSFRSAWIAEQGHLRKKSVAELDELAKSGYTFKVKDTLTRQSGGTVVNMGAGLKALGYDQTTIDLILANKDKAMELFEEVAKANEESE